MHRSRSDAVGTRAPSPGHGPCHSPGSRAAHHLHGLLQGRGRALEGPSAKDLGRRGEDTPSGSSPGRAARNPDSEVGSQTAPGTIQGPDPPSGSAPDQVLHCRGGRIRTHDLFVPDELRSRSLVSWLVFPQVKRRAWIIPACVAVVPEAERLPDGHRRTSVGGGQSQDVGRTSLKSRGRTNLMARQRKFGPSAALVGAVRITSQSEERCCDISQREGSEQAGVAAKGFGQGGSRERRQGPAHVTGCVCE